MDEKQEFKDKIRSLSLMGSKRDAKKTVDVHDHHTVEVTEHWDDRVDVTLKPETVRVKAKGSVGEGLAPDRNG